MNFDERLSKLFKQKVYFEKKYIYIYIYILNKLLFNDYDTNIILNSSLKK